VGNTDRCVAGLSGGQAEIAWWTGRASHEPPPGWNPRVELRTVPWHWGVYGGSPFPDIHQVEFPLYIPFAVLALPSACLIYRDRRRVRWAGAGRCVRCGYDLSGLPPGICP